MKIFNTLTHSKEDFIPHNNNKVTMYTCGPTVYNYAHIGNLRTYITEDVLEKTLNYLGYSVTRCMNITDVGHLSGDSDTGKDKMVSKAIKEQKSVLDIAKFYTTAFKTDFEKLNNKWPQIVSNATDNIDEYIKIISNLIAKGYAYIANGNVYFDTSKLSEYYVLNNIDKDKLEMGIRDTVEEDLSKKNKTDFVLWFTKSKFDNQELKWDSPWGKGYPGWHIECSGIAIKNLGEYLDIHCGAVDNIFPHHTNEIAQSEAYLNHKWCNYWIHGEHLNVNTGKMSKSTGNFLTVDTLQKQGYSPLVYRFYCLQSHYRKQLVFSYKSMDIANNALNKLYNKINKLDPNNYEVEYNLIKEHETKFKQYLADDLNTANALTVLYDVIKSNLNDKSKLYLIKSFDQVLSLDLTKTKTKSNIDEEYILNQIALRNEYKKNKQYEQADTIRNELLKQGIVLKDTKEKTIYEIN